MARKKDVRSLISDIKRHGRFYIKSRETKAAIESTTKDITFTWDKEDQLYIAEYKPLVKG